MNNTYIKIYIYIYLYIYLYLKRRRGYIVEVNLINLILYVMYVDE